LPPLTSPAETSLKAGPHIVDHLLHLGTPSRIPGLAHRGGRQMT
jgi:hypothetical protein